MRSVFEIVFEWENLAFRKLQHQHTDFSQASDGSIPRAKKALKLLSIKHTNWHWNSNHKIDRFCACVVGNFAHKTKKNSVVLIYCQQTRITTTGARGSLVLFGLLRLDLAFYDCCRGHNQERSTPKHTNGDNLAPVSNRRLLIKLRYKQQSFCKMTATLLDKIFFFFGVFWIDEIYATQEHIKSQLYRRKIGTFTHPYQIRTSIKFTRNAPGTLYKIHFFLSQGEQEQDSRTLFINWNFPKHISTSRGFFAFRGLYWYPLGGFLIFPFKYFLWPMPTTLNFLNAKRTKFPWANAKNKKILFPEHTRCNR